MVGEERKRKKVPCGLFQKVWNDPTIRACPATGGRHEARLPRQQSAAPGNLRVELFSKSTSRVEP